MGLMAHPDWTRGGEAVETAELALHHALGGETIRALDGVDLKVEPGQFVAVCGRSGSGKTSLFHALAGLERPTQGRVRIGSTDLTHLSVGARDRFRRRHIGLVFQFFNLVASLTVDMNIALPLLLDGRRMRDVRVDVDQLAEALGIAGRRTHAPDQLSGGEMQRVAIARALIVRPRVILADEPTGNLDKRRAHEILGLLREQSEERGVTTVVMTHELEASSYADRVIELEDGRVVGDTCAS